MTILKNGLGNSDERKMGEKNASPCASDSVPGSGHTCGGMIQSVPFNVDWY